MKISLYYPSTEDTSLAAIIELPLLLLFHKAPNGLVPSTYLTVYNPVRLLRESGADLNVLKVFSVFIPTVVFVLFYYNLLFSLH